MQRAVEGLSIVPDEVLVDGSYVFCCGEGILVKSIVKGDQKIKAISAASIIAKVYRDDLMRSLAKGYPEYGFEVNMGYPTKSHLDALNKYGVTDIHRKSYAPVKRVLFPEII